MSKETSFIDAAVVILQNEKKPFNLYDLFDRIAADQGVDDSAKAELITKFYTDLTTSAKFVYVGDNEWNLKANEKIELWEKDGSFYKEYTVVELPEEYKKDEFAATKKPKPAVKPAPVEEKAEVAKEPVKEEVNETKEEPVVEPVVEPAVTKPIKVDAPDSEDEYEEEVFEDYEDFDEDKYNEYMDTYEDQYDD